MRKSLLNVYKSLVPENIFNRIKEHKKIEPFSILDVSFLYVDISGFTRMSEILSKYGREGTEELTKIINQFFLRLIEIIKKFKGCIYRFGGDAIFSFFEGEDKEEKAVECAISTMSFVNKIKEIKKFRHSFKIGIHIGIASGKIFFKDLQTDYFIGGKVLKILSKIVSEAKKGEIIICYNTYKKLKKGKFVKKGKYYLLKRYKRIKPPEIKGEKSIYSKNILAELENYIPEFLVEKLNSKPYFEAKDGEHKNVTSVFIYFTHFTPDKDYNKASKTLEKFFAIIKEKSKNFGGYINKFDIGDKGERVFITFGFPKTLEDDEKRAINFCYEIINEKSSKELGLRIGINSGKVFAGPVGSGLRSEFTIMGDAVNLAARLASKAKAGEILIPDRLANKVSDVFEIKEKGTLRLKGKKKKIKVFKIFKRKKTKVKEIKKWVSESSVIIGRDQEIKRIKSMIDRVMDKNGQVILITGEAGVGKSRLKREIINLCLTKKFKVYEGNCVSYGSSLSYYPWTQILNNLFGILSSDITHIRKKKIWEKVKEVKHIPKGWLPLIGEPIGVKFQETSLTKFISAKMRKQKIFELIFKLLKHEVKKMPLLIVIEDFQWSDSASIDFLNYIVRNIERVPFLIVVVSRPLVKRYEFMEKKWFKSLN